MGNKLKWHRDKIVVENPHNSKRKWRTEGVENLVNHLWNVVVRIDGVRLRDLFKLVSDYVDYSTLWDNVLQEYALWPFIHEYRDIRRKRPFKNPWVDSIVVSRHAEINEWNESLDFQYSIHVSGTKRGCKINRGISLCNLHELLDAKIRWNKTVTLTDWRKKPEPGKQFWEVLSVNEHFTVLEIVKNIFWELTFHGGPKERKEFADELGDTVKKAKKGAKEGKLKTFNIDEMKEELGLNEPRKKK